MITVKDFCEKFKKDGVINTKIAPDAVSEYIKKELEVKDYIPFVEKRELCTKVLNACNTVDRNTGLVRVDSVSRYIIFTITIISKYTNIEFSSGKDNMDFFDEYDMLCKNDLLNQILDVIGEEYETCNNMLNMMMNDVVANNNTVENVLGSAANKMLGIIDDFIDVLSDKVEELNLDLSQIDIDKYKGLLELMPRK